MDHQTSSQDVLRNLPSSSSSLPSSSQQFLDHLLPSSVSSVASVPVASSSKVDNSYEEGWGGDLELSEIEEVESVSF